MSTQSQRRAKRRKTVPGYPWDRKFESVEDARAYVSGIKVRCLICGKWYRSLGGHLGTIHDCSAEDYKERFGIPYGIGLCGCETIEKHRAFAVLHGNLTPDLMELGRQNAHIQVGNRPIVHSVMNQRSIRIATVNSSTPINRPCCVCGLPVQCAGAQALGAKKRCPQCIAEGKKLTDDGRERLSTWRKENSDRHTEYSKAKSWWTWQRNPVPLLKYAEKWGARLRILPQLIAEMERRSS